MKKAIVFLVVSILAVGLVAVSGCGSGSSVVGKYQVDMHDDQVGYVQFNADKTAKRFDAASGVFDGTYTTSGTQITALYSEYSKPVVYTIKDGGNKLHEILYNNKDYTKVTSK